MISVYLLLDYKDNTREGGSFVRIICYLFLSASSRVL